jgi:LacI family transcriptional regulator
VVPDLPIPAVLLDNREAAREAVTHLVGLGHRRIGMVAGKSHITSTIDRLAGYRSALDDAEIAFDESLVASGASRTDEARTATRTLMDLADPPTALFVANNLMTIGAVAAIEERGLTIPGDIAIVGFDDFDWANVFRPTLTCVAQPTYELGRAAAELVLDRIRDHAPNSKPAHIVVLPGQLVIRESSGSPVHAAAAAARR